jgi:membrane protease YdiL (CAAX protease family)
MKSNFRISFSKLRKSNFFVSLLLLFLLYLGFYVIWTLVYYVFWKQWDILFVSTPNETLMKQSIFEQILQAVIIVPLIETLIFQKWTYKLLSLTKFLKQRKILIMFLSAVIFGIIHFYSLSYIVYNVFTGFLFMFAYIVKLHKKPYWTVVTLHGLINLFAILIDPIEQHVFGMI